MNQFVIDITASQSGRRSGHPVAGDSRLPAAGRAGPVRPAWPFLVNPNRQDDKRALAQESGGPSGFAS